MGVLMAAAAAQASAPLASVSGGPNPSTVGQSVTLTATFTGTCDGTVAFTDGGNGNAALCTATVPGTNTGTCLASFPTPGVRTVTGTPSGTFNCVGTAQTYSQTVNAAAIVPTVGEWTMWGLASLLLIGGAVMLARRTRQTAGPDDLGAA